MEQPGALDAAAIRRFLDLSVDLMAVSNLETEILAASRSFSRLGWDPDEVIGVRVLDLIHPEDLARAQDELVSVLAGGQAVAVDARLRARDGSYRWVQGNATADLAAGRIYFTGADIGERMAMEEQLRAQIRLEELVASVAAGLIGTDSSDVEAEIERGLGRLGTALRADGAYFLRDGRHPADAVFVEWSASGRGRRERDRVPLSPAARRWWEERLAGGPVQITDVGQLGDDAVEVRRVLEGLGVRSVLLVPLPRHRRFTGFVGLVTVDEPAAFPEHVGSLLRLAGECFMSKLEQSDTRLALLDARRELEHRNEELELSNEELERFAYSAAHDLKSPLARVEMALMAAPAGGDGTGELLDIARRGAARMRQLIEDLLDYATVQTRVGEPERVDLDALLTEVLDDLDVTLSAAAVRVERQPLPVVVGHRSLLGQLLQNLVGNAVKFRREGATPLLRVDSLVEDGGVTVRITDNGIGIPPEQRGDVFGIFTRLQGDDRYVGSGIGLATCAKVVSQHGGRIWIDDGVDGGCAVHVWLPATPAR